MADSEDIQRQLSELEQRRQLMKRQREECEKQLAQIDAALATLTEDQDHRVREITDRDSREA